MKCADKENKRIVMDTTLRLFECVKTWYLNIGFLYFVHLKTTVYLTTNITDMTLNLFIYQN